MRTSRSISSALTLFVLAICISCSGLPESEIVEPQDTQGYYGDAYVDRDYDLDNDHPFILGEDNDRTPLQVQIRVEPCDISSQSRSQSLMAYHPTAFNTAVYSLERYNVRWYSTNGVTLSQSIELGCIASGTYFVDIVDNITGSAGRASISL